MQLILRTVLLVTVFGVVFAQEECLTPTKSEGTCIPLTECKYLTPKKSLTPPERVILTQWHCGFKGDVPKVCCPFEINNIAEKENNVVLKPRVQNLKQHFGPHCSSMVSPFDFIPPCCGTETIAGNKIIGGTPTSIGQYPWLAIIEYIEPFVCGGTLISSLYVLTAAHCVITTDKISTGATSVRLGDYNTTNTGPDCMEVDGGGKDCTEGEISIPIASIIAHENYGSETTIYHSDDIALIKLSEMAPYTEFIRPICLPKSDITQGQPTDLWFIIAGWGAVNATLTSANIKLHTNVPFVNQKNCREKFYGRRGTTMIWDKQMCAGGERDKDSCKGDSGGPLMYSNGTYQQLVGVSSFGASQCGILQPSVYTRVYNYLEWIEINTKP